MAKSQASVSQESKQFECGVNLILLVTVQGARVAIFFFNIGR